MITGKKKQPDSIDVAVGHRIRIQRLASGMSQSALADQLGVTFQQVQKYEKGVNRVGASRLTERGATRADDRASEAAMEDRKREGYF